MRRSVASPGVQAADKDFASDVQYYLGLEPRQLPSRYLYDALGSALFNAICELPWYGIARAELRLLARHGRTIGERRKGRRVARVIELGPGNGTKLLTLLEAADLAGGASLSRERPPRPLDVRLVDVSAAALAEAERTVASLDGVEIAKHRATYEAGLDEAVRGRVDGRTLLLFLGSNIGNFDRPCAEAFLRHMRSALSAGDELLLGADLIKPERDLLLAYDDPLGVTAAFNRNLLSRINRELGGDFDLAAFAHRAVWNAEESRVEMHLVSLKLQHVRVPAAGIEIALDEGETIWTESSYKYDLEELTALLESAHFRPIARWTTMPGDDEVSGGPGDPGGRGGSGSHDERFALVLAQAE